MKYLFVLLYFLISYHSFIGFQNFDFFLIARLKDLYFGPEGQRKKK